MCICIFTGGHVHKYVQVEWNAIFSLCRMKRDLSQENLQRMTRWLIIGSSYDGGRKELSSDVDVESVFPQSINMSDGLRSFVKTEWEDHGGRRDKWQENMLWGYSPLFIGTRRKFVYGISPPSSRPEQRFLKGSSVGSVLMRTTELELFVLSSQLVDSFVVVHRWPFSHRPSSWICSNEQVQVGDRKALISICTSPWNPRIYSCKSSSP